ncbi:sensor histidine kinase [Noviherbaspirillum sedimenti]|uniref:histidine kinase n=1 Tax=Noviherbaspirillum sedimenti TaxID=2320865 RepID=A0A3A3GSH0_9BURK|nr:ATP-binding protein [Noviherbaspirillum sedimenti]RJG03930.1 hypothetical protein D3878_21960 [Noviherbaspirillum sedimenti]
MLVLRMDMVRLCDKITETQPNLRGATSTILEQLGTVMQSLRDVIRDLRPAVLDAGLRSAVEWHCREFTRRFGIACNLTWNAGDVVLPERHITALFRTLQEALSNVHRHARANMICVIVNTDHNNIVMTVVDDGIGIEFDNNANENSYGLTGMRERIIALGGKLSICSAPNQGMSLTISLPI